MGLDSVELIMTWEEEFDVSISDANAESLTTPRIAADCIERILIKNGRSIERSELDAIIRRTTLEQRCTKEEDYHIDAEFVRDMGFN